MSQIIQIKYDDLFELINEMEIRKEKKNKDINIKIDKPFNRLIFGAPGTGKSYRVSEDIIKYNLEKTYERITFYPNYTFSQFVGTYKPVTRMLNGEKKVFYEYIPGPFLRVLVKAKKNPDNNYLLVIEEINRANAAAIFGDIFQLLDRTSFGESKYGITISEDMKEYLEREDLDINILKIPQNMYIWATMNSADQNVYHMDMAFKRRWTSEYIGINENLEAIKNIKVNLNKKEYYWNDIRKALNKKLIQNGINEDKLIGPYFFNFEELKSLDKEFEKIFINKLLIYLYEDVLRHKKVNFFGDKVNSISDIESFYKDKMVDMLKVEEILPEILCKE